MSTYFLLFEKTLISLEKGENMILTQIEADMLFQQPKHFNVRILQLPAEGQQSSLDVFDKENQKIAVFDIRKGRRSHIIVKLTKMLRDNENIIRRLEINGPYHTNPLIKKIPNNLSPRVKGLMGKYEGKKISRNHLHLYINGYDNVGCNGDKWAFPINAITEINNPWEGIIVSTGEHGFCSLKKGFTEESLITQMLKYCNIDLNFHISNTIY